MTTLKAFQAEIEQISHEKQQASIQAAREAHLAAELAKHHGKAPKKDEVVIEEKAVAAEEEDEPSLEVSLPTGPLRRAIGPAWMAVTDSRI